MTNFEKITKDENALTTFIDTYIQCEKRPANCSRIPCRWAIMFKF